MTVDKKCNFLWPQMKIITNEGKIVPLNNENKGKNKIENTEMCVCVFVWKMLKGKSWLLFDGV